MAAKNTPSKVLSRSASARYILLAEGSEVFVMNGNLESFADSFHRKLNR